jgi:hypothetical protein
MSGGVPPLPSPICRCGVHRESFTHSASFCNTKHVNQALLFSYDVWHFLCGRRWTLCVDLKITSVRNYKIWNCGDGWKLSSCNCVLRDYDFICFATPCACVINPWLTSLSWLMPVLHSLHRISMTFQLTTSYEPTSCNSLLTDSE